MDHLDKMYSAIDAQDWPAVLRFYKTDCVYQRPGYKPIRGKEELDAFYRHHRAIASGQHRVHRWLRNENQSVAIGEFEGRLKTAEPVYLRYADLFTFDGGLIAARETFFFAPLA